MDKTYRRRYPRYRSYTGSPMLDKQIAAGENKSTGRSYKSPYNNYRKYRRVSGYYWKGGLYGRFIGVGSLAPEYKFFDTYIQAHAMTNAGTVPITTGVLISRGTGANDRIGDRIMVRSIQFKWQVTALNATLNIWDNVVADACFRIMIVQDTQCNGQNPLVDDVLRNGKDSGSPQDPAFVDRVRNVTWSARYKVLYDCKMDLNAQAHSIVNTFNPTTGQTTSAAHFVTWERKCGDKYLKTNIPVMYDNAGAGININNIRTNNLAVMVGTNTEATGLLLGNFQFRVRYQDQ